MTTTTTYSFNTPAAGTEENTWGGLLNANFDSIDDILDGTTPIVSARLTVYSLTGTAIDPANGNVQHKSISTGTTFTETFAEGDSVMLLLTISSSAVPTWPTMEWVGGSAPSLPDGKHAISLFHADGDLIGNYLGPVS